MAAHDPCPFGDPYCPCPDGDACHYVDLPGSPAMTPPEGEDVRLPPNLVGVPEGQGGVELPED